MQHGQGGEGAGRRAVRRPGAPAGHLGHADLLAVDAQDPLAEAGEDPPGVAVAGGGVGRGQVHGLQGQGQGAGHQGVRTDGREVGGEGLALEGIGQRDNGDGGVGQVVVGRGQVAGGEGGPGRAGAVNRESLVYEGGKHDGL